MGRGKPTRKGVDLHPFNIGPKPNYDFNRFIYHYTRLETARDYILSSRTLRFNRLARVNDPKESKSNDWQLFGKSGDDLAAINDRVVEYFRMNAKVVCFSRDDQNIASPDHFYLDRCSQGHVKPRMWATYGDQHKGVCLVFDRNRLESVFKTHKDPKDRLLFGSVQYGRGLTRELASAFSLRSSDFVDDFTSAIQNQIEQHAKSYFFFKHIDWITENEYRFVLVGNEQKDIDLPYENALVGIALGIETSPDGTNEIISIADKSGIPVIRTHWGLNHSRVEVLNEFAKEVTEDFGP